MADYTNITRVRSILPEGVKIDETTKPRLAEVLVMIDETNSQVDVALATVGASEPLTTDDLFKVFQKRCTREVCYQIYAARGAEASGLDAGDRRSSPLWSRWHKEFEEMLTGIVENGLAAVLNPDSGPESETMDADDTDPFDPKGPKIRWEDPF